MEASRVMMIVIEDKLIGLQLIFYQFNFSGSTFNQCSICVAVLQMKEFLILNHGPFLLQTSLCFVILHHCPCHILEDASTASPSLARWHCSCLLQKCNTIILNSYQIDTILTHLFISSLSTLRLCQFKSMNVISKRQRHISRPKVRGVCICVCVTTTKQILLLMKQLVQH